MKDNNFYDVAKARLILEETFDIKGEVSSLPGEMDSNFLIVTPRNKFILKISKPEADQEDMKSQYEILEFLALQDLDFKTPKFIKGNDGNFVSPYKDEEGIVYVRLLTWIEGKIWSDYETYDEHLLNNLGRAAGNLTNALNGFDHESSFKSDFDWDICHTAWTKKYQELFKGEKEELINFFYKGFEEIEKDLDTLRKSVVHNDLNDNNIILNFSEEIAKVEAIIDFGDSTFTASINDLAICLTYAMMNKTRPLEAGSYVVQGYHTEFPLLEEELEMLYWLVGARLVISLTKAALNRQLEPENEYHQISEEPAWDLIRKWRKINPMEATAFFRKSCGFTSHSSFEVFQEFLSKNNWSVMDMIALPKISQVHWLELDISSSVIESLDTYRDRRKLHSAIEQIWRENDKPLIVAGYNQVRCDFITDSHRIETNKGYFWECLLLGIEFWLYEKCNVKAILPGKVILNESAGTVTIASEIAPGNLLYLTYENLQLDRNIEEGEQVEKQTILGQATVDKNGPLFFKLSLLEPESGETRKSCLFNEQDVYKELFPDPGEIFKEMTIRPKLPHSPEKLLNLRKAYLGKSLSVSYRKPLKMVRGDGTYLIDHTGRKYLDLVNNVAHVGHEHPRVVKAGQKQMGMLNTNSRYLHDTIVEFAQDLLATFPEELSVVHFVNSGSEANELAIRMAKAYTGKEDFIAIEEGYHGNTNACIGISSYKFDGKGGRGAPPTTHVVPMPDGFRGRYQGKDCGSRYAAHVREVIGLLSNKNRKPAAFIAESIISCGGQVELPENYLREAYEYVREAGGICIADEVQVGCGRVGKTFWGFQLHDVTPDIVTIGKPLGNGHPLAAVVCKKEIAEAFNNGMEYFNTFGGNPVSCAIGNEVLKVIKDESLRENAAVTGTYLKEELKKLQVEFPIIGDVRGEGLFLGFELLDRSQTPLPKEASYLVERMRELGILMSTEGPDHNVLKIKPPIVFNKDNTDEFIGTLSTVLREEYMQTNQ